VLEITIFKNVNSYRCCDYCKGLVSEEVVVYRITNGFVVQVVCYECALKTLDHIQSRLKAELKTSEDLKNIVRKGVE
jgi:hypothetical protein